MFVPLSLRRRPRIALLRKDVRGRAVSEPLERRALLSAAVPTGLTATAVDDNTVRVDWTPDPSDGTTFEVDRQNPDGTWTPLPAVDDAADGDTLTDAGLAGATAYAYRVRADDGTPGGTSPFADAVPVTTPLTTPDAPTGLSATEAMPGEVDLGWAEDSPIVTGYAVTATPLAGGSATTYAVAGDAQAFAATGLTAGVAYTFAVAADNDPGNGHDAQSAPSDAVTAVPSRAVLVAEAPATVAEGAPFTLTLASYLPGGGLSPITSWQAAWGDTGTADAVAGATGTVDHAPAAGAGEATATVTASDAAGDTFTLPEVDVVVVPAAPDGLSAAVASPTEVDLSWTDRSAAAAAGDVVYASADGGATFAPVAEVAAVAAGAANAYAATGLTPGTAYQFYVTADGGGAESAPTATVSAATAFVPPTLDAQGSGSAVEGGTYALDLSAQYPDGEPGAVDHWLVAWPGGTASYPASADPTVVATGTIAGGPSVTLAVTAVDLVNGSFAADPQQSYGLTVAVTPAAPTAVTATGAVAADGSGEADLSWVNGSAFAAGVVVLMSGDGGATFLQQGEVTAAGAAGTTASYAVTGLAAGTAYQFELASDGGAGGGWSAVTAPVAVTTPAAPAPTLTVTPAAPAAEGQTYTLGLSATDAAGRASDRVDHWTVDWGDGSAAESFAGAVTAAAHDYPTGTAAAAVTVAAVDAAGDATTVWNAAPVAVAPAAPTGTWANYAADGASATVNWYGQTALAGAAYAVQRQDPAPMDGSGSPGAWATVGTVAATADGQQHGYSYVDVGTAAVATAGGGLYRVVSAGPGATPASGAAPGAGATAASASTVPNVNLPSGLAYEYIPGYAATGVTEAGLPPLDPADPWDPGPPLPYDQPLSFTVSGLPAHMTVSLNLSAWSSDDTLDADDYFTVSGPGGRTWTYGEGSGGPLGLSYVDPAAAGGSASFTVTPHLNATDAEGNPVTWTMGEVFLSTGLAPPSVLNAGLTAGGVYDLTVGGQATSGDPAAPPVVLHVADCDADVLQPLSNTVTLDADGHGTLRVRAIKPGLANLVLADAAGDAGGNLFGVGYVRVGADPGEGGEPVVGGGAAAPAVGPSFTFVMPSPSAAAVTVGYAVGGDADPALYAGLSGTVTFPAGVSYVTVPLALDYGYAKVSADQTIVVTIDGQRNDAGGPIQASLTVADMNGPGVTVGSDDGDSGAGADDTPAATPMDAGAGQPAASAITIGGVTDDANIPVDPEGDDAKLVPLAMSGPIYGHANYWTLTWNPQEDVIWPTKHVGPAGTDLSSYPTASVDYYDGVASFTWCGAPPADVYVQAIAGSVSVDGTYFGLAVDVSMPATATAAATEATRESSASGTQSGLVLFYGGSPLNLDTLPHVIVGEEVTLSAEYEGPYPLPANPTYAWKVGGKTATEFVAIVGLTEQPSGKQTSIGGRIDLHPQPSDSQVTFFWYSGSLAGQTFDVSCILQGATPVRFGSASGTFDVFRPSVQIDATDPFPITVNGTTGTNSGGVYFTLHQPPIIPNGFSSGTYEYIQVIQSAQYTMKNTKTGKFRSEHSSGLDSGSPYHGPDTPANANTSDDPGVSNLDKSPFAANSFSLDFNASMYLMWNPNTNASKNDPNWVPLRKVVYNYSFAETKKAWGFSVDTQSVSSDPRGTGIKLTDQDSPTYPSWNKFTSKAENGTGDSISTNA